MITKLHMLSSLLEEPHDNPPKEEKIWNPMKTIPEAESYIILPESLTVF